MNIENELKKIIDNIFLENLKQFRCEIMNDIIESKLESFRAMKKLYEHNEKISLKFNEYNATETKILNFIIEGLKAEIETLASHINEETMVIHFDEKYKNWELIPQWRIKDE